MANEVERIVEQLERVVVGPAWHGPALLEIVSGLSPARACARPGTGVHSIWELLHHVTAWSRAVELRLDGERAELTPEQDWPAVTSTGKAAWKSSLRDLETTHRSLVSRVRKLPATRLERPILPGMSSVYLTLHGLIQHHVYHAGQMALLKKALRGRLSG